MKPSSHFSRDKFNVVSRLSSFICVVTKRFYFMKNHNILSIFMFLFIYSIYLKIITKIIIINVIFSYLFIGVTPRPPAKGM